MGHVHQIEAKTLVTINNKREEVRKVVLNKLCNIFADNIFKKKENSDKILDEGLTKLVVLLYFIAFACNAKSFANAFFFSSYFTLFKDRLAKIGYSRVTSAVLISLDLLEIFAWKMFINLKFRV